MRKLAFCLFSIVLFAPIAFGAFPSLRSSANTNNGTGTSHSITLPATIESGDLLVVVFSQYNDGGSLTWDNSTAGTWTNKIADDYFALVSQDIYVKKADGTEDSKTLSITTANSIKTTAISFAIKDRFDSLVNGTGLEFAYFEATSSANPDPPSVTPTWGDDDNMYVVMLSQRKSQTISVYPYPDNNLLEQTGSDTSPTTAICSDELTGTSQDPGTFTTSASMQYAVTTMAVRPLDASILPILDSHRRRRAQ